jgi:hypothetical protein
MRSVDAARRRPPARTCRRRPHNGPVSHRLFNEGSVVLSRPPVPTGGVAAFPDSGGSPPTTNSCMTSSTDWPRDGPANDRETSGNDGVVKRQNPLFRSGIQHLFAGQRIVLKRIPKPRAEVRFLPGALPKAAGQRAFSGPVGDDHAAYGPVLVPRRTRSRRDGPPIMCSLHRSIGGRPQLDAAGSALGGLVKSAASRSPSPFRRVGPSLPRHGSGYWDEGRIRLDRKAFLQGRRGSSIRRVQPADRPLNTCTWWRSTAFSS